ncbi:MAG: 3-phosphoshikimate 1-carboxyvinyltransferase [Bacteroidota bacterium]
MRYRISHPNRTIKANITLNGSKSIANRALIIQALCAEDFQIRQLSNSKDTVTLKALLEQFAQASTNDSFDAGAAGTTYRFMTAYLALQEGTQLLTGSERMKQRPIGVLADAMNDLGADIEYLEKEGYPPLKINAPHSLGKCSELSIAASTSSQYISALLMIAPTLPNGLNLTLEGKIVSRPYIEMTLNLMQYFGVTHEWEGQTIRIASQTYRAKDFTVEADWSAASYPYLIAAFAEEVDVQLNGLFQKSVQGDAVLVEMMQQFGVQTTFNEQGIHLQKSGQAPTPSFKYDFLRCPDLAQSIAVLCGGLGIPAHFKGLETLRIKETDRIAALQEELAKVEVEVTAIGDEEMQISGKATFNTVPIFDTYEDHRMAMSFAPLGIFAPIEIAEPMVVVKSYPNYYEHLQTLGFSCINQ